MAIAYQPAMSALWLAVSVVAITAQSTGLPAQAVQPVAQAPPPAAAPTQKPEEGIPITSAVVQKACASCHKPDEKQQLTRISFQRNTPEGWQVVVQRMAALNGLKIDTATAREVVRYLSNHLGLAPEEARPAAFEVEKRVTDYKYTANADAEAVCIKCHSMGRVISQRRTRNEWDLLVAMHRGWYPLVDNQAFRRGGPAPRDPSPDGRPPDRRQPVEKAIEHLSRAFPFQTPEWSAWSANMRPARLAGTWALSGSEIGKGPLYGRVVIAAVAGTTDEFTTDTTYTYARTGERVARKGRAIVYTGFQWRGQSTSAPPATSPPAGSSGAEQADDTTMREVMFVDRNWQKIDGRWFTGGYDELGIDVQLERADRETVVLGADRTALRAGGPTQQVKIYGLNLSNIKRIEEVDLGPGVAVVAVSSTPDVLTLTVDVAPGATIGARDLFVAGAARPKVLAIYNQVDAIKVTPTWGMARVGGAVFPKMLAQFEARAVHNGADGKPDTPDDVDLGIVPATWSLEEYAATYDDDDVKFVGTVDAKTGRFTPNLDGPNPARRGSRNNIGDVWMVATYTPEATGGNPPATLRARAHLLVTAPLYRRWEPPAGQQ